MARIAVVGSINLDLVVATAALPERGETVIGHDLRRFGGGKGANQALAAARMGGAVELIGRVGRDDAGRYLLGELSMGGVGVEHVESSDGPTGTALITVDAQGANTIVIVPAANALLTADDVEAARSEIESRDALILQLEVPIETSTRAARLAREVGRLVFLNPSPVQPIPAELLEAVSYVVLNAGELRLLAGDSNDPVRLLDRGVGAVVVTLGERGARLVSRKGEIEVDAYPVEPVDTTAAGDAFLGALAATLPERGEEAALDAAVAAGAIAVTRWGAQPSLPTLAEVDALIHRGRADSPA
jgi:ribokinase